MKAFRLALQFLTVIRFATKDQFEEIDFAHSLRWFFAAGLLIGAIQFGLALVSIHLNYSAEIAACIIVVAGVLITGGLHLDGTADTADGLGAGYDRQSALRIMKDERLGVYGVAAIVIGLYLKILASRFALQGQNTTALLISPMISRALLACTCTLLPYARDAGTGKAFSEGIFFLHALPSLLFSFALSLLIFRDAAWIPLIFTTGVVTLFCIYCVIRIRGYTGDTLGFQNELAEIIFLIAA